MIHKTSTQKKTYSPEDIVTYNHTHTDITSYDKIGIVRAVSGSVLLGAGLITLPLPTGSIFMVGLGCWLLGYDSKVLVTKTTYKLKLLFNWFYCNRTPKKIRRTIKARLLIW